MTFPREKIYPGDTHIYVLSLLCILHNVEQILYPTCIFREYKPLLLASKLSYLPMQLQPVQVEVGR